MTGQEVRVGIIGGGLMGREIAAALGRWPALVDHPVRPRLVGVCDINPEALEWFRGIDTVDLLVTDHHDLLADPSIDVVYVAVRHDLHATLYSDVIRAGKDLLAEKPFGIDRAAAEEVFDTMRAHPNSFVRVSSEMPFFPGAQLAVEIVTSGALGRLVEARSAFLHSSDYDVRKPINWKRQSQYCGRAGVLNDLGMHAWHVPLRLGWIPCDVTAVVQNLVPERPNADGDLVLCDTWDNAVTWSTIPHSLGDFPLVTETKRIAPGHKNTWELEVSGMDGSVRFSTKNPKRVEILGQIVLPRGAEQAWQAVDVGSQSVWPTVTGAIFESGFSDAILQMWAVFLAERAGALGGAFGTARPDEAVLTHRIYEAALSAAERGARVAVDATGLMDRTGLA